MLVLLKVSLPFFLWNYVDKVQGLTCQFTAYCSGGMVNPECGYLPSCRDTPGNEACLVEQPCTEVFRLWSQCTVTCGGGSRIRTGRCCGSKCSKDINQTESCNTQPCTDDVDGMWSHWGSWVTTPCSVSCCGGVQNKIRQRTCTMPPPMGNGQTCSGDMTETDADLPCNTQECPLSCEMVPVGVIFNDPCVACSNFFYACSGGNLPVRLSCPTGFVWSPMNIMCQETCDP